MRKIMRFTLGCFFVLMLNSCLASSVDTIYIQDYGAKGDNVNDDSRAIQKAIDDAFEKEASVVLFEPNKTYRLDYPVNIPDKIIVDGQGSEVIPSVEFYQTNGEYASLFNIVNVDSAELRNMVVNIQGQRKKGQSHAVVFNSLLILASSNTVVENVTFLNSGLPYDGKNLKNGPHILILSQDEGEEFSYLTENHKNIIGSSSNNIIRNCKFINDKTVSGFAIRILSNWTKRKKTESYKNLTRDNEIVDCRFEGGFEWNTIELAGAGTVGNNIENNHISGKSINNIDIDKGSSNNIIQGNTLVDCGLPEMFNENKNVRCAPIMVHGSNPDYLAYNNEVINNRITNVINPEKENSRYLYSGGIGLTYVDGVEVRNNKLSNIYPGQKYGGAIVLDQTVRNATIIDNELDNSYWGILFTPNGKHLENIVIEKNTIKSMNYGILLNTQLSQGNYANSKITDNVVTSAQEAGIKVGTKLKKSELLNNSIKKDN